MKRLFKIICLCLLVLGLAIPSFVEAATSYANSGGTGDRTAIITATQSPGAYNPLFINSTSVPQVVNGDHATGDHYFNPSAVVDEFIKFDFGAGNKVKIDEAKFYQTDTSAQGTWKWQGSDDDSSWTDIGTSFALGGATTQTITAMSANTTYYRYYKLLGVSGDASADPYVYDFEFKLEWLAATDTSKFFQLF